MQLWLIHKYNNPALLPCITNRPSLKNKRPADFRRRGVCIH